MDKQDDLRPHLPHLGTKRLIAYRQGKGTAAERDAVQEHLSLCPRCTGLLRELKDFEAAAESGAMAPEPLRQEAWAALVERLPAKSPALRPVTPFPRSRARSVFRAATIAVAALLLAVAGLALLVRMDRQRLTGLERRLAAREETLSGLKLSLADAVRQLDAAHGRIRSLETESTSRAAELERLRRSPPSAPPAHGDRLAAANLEVSLAPRFVLRGEESPEGEFLRSGDKANRVKIEDGAFTVGLDLPDSPAFPEVRLELTDRSGKVVWSGRRPGGALLGDDGTSLTIHGLKPGRYRLRVEGLQPASTRFLAEYLLDVES